MIEQKNQNETAGGQSALSGWLGIFFKIRLLIARIATPKTHKIAPIEPSIEMLDVEFFGDIGSGFDSTHKLLRKGEYYFSTRQDALDFGRGLYRAMIERA